jgi:hypothetical protein
MDRRNTHLSLQEVNHAESGRFALRWPRSRPTKIAWAGASRGCRPMEAISISTITCRLRAKIAEDRVYYNYGTRPVGASEEQRISVFYKNERGEVFHTYSCHGRGIDMVNGAYQFLDLVPKGRNEDGFDFSMEWIFMLSTILR